MRYDRAKITALAVVGYYVLMTGWIYWLDAGHGNSWWGTIPIALAQLAFGFALNRWWATLLPLPLPLIALPLGYPESQYSEPAPLWFGMMIGVAFAIPLVLAGVVARKVGEHLRRSRPVQLEEA